MMLAGGGSFSFLLLWLVSGMAGVTDAFVHGRHCVVNKSSRNLLFTLAVLFCSIAGWCSRSRFRFPWEGGGKAVGTVWLWATRSMSITAL